jgi:hypothetical protein
MSLNEIREEQLQKRLRVLVHISTTSKLSYNENSVVRKRTLGYNKYSVLMNPRF